MMAEAGRSEEALSIPLAGGIGQPAQRRDGAPKVTGRARYAADLHRPGMLYASPAFSRVARGRVLGLDLDAARAHPGVVAVITPANRLPLAGDPDVKPDLATFRLDLLQNDGVRYANQPVAVVIADTLEAATEGARLLSPRYALEPICTDFDMAAVFTPPMVGMGASSDLLHGDLAAGFAEAQCRIEAEYRTPEQYQNPLEPHAILAEWQAERLIIDTPSQAIARARARIAGLFGLAAENVLIRSPFLGGGFGSKAFLSGPQILAILAAKHVGRPVKLVLRRQDMYGPVGHRSATRQLLHIGINADGHLTALAHHATIASSRFDDFFEPAALASRALYACPAIGLSHRAVRLDTGTPIFMRAPGEAPGSLALESAMDEAAFAAGLDPLEFRLRNYAEAEPVSGKPFSSKALRDCYRAGAERFGWYGRPLSPRAMRDADGFRLGWGVGTAIFPTLMFQGAARAIISADGCGVVECGAQDMGQGAATVLQQIAADTLNLGAGRVALRSGRSDLPDAGIAGGSAQTATAGQAVLDACLAVVARLATLAAVDPRSPLFGAGNARIVIRDGRLCNIDDDGESDSISEVLLRAGLSQIEASGTAFPDAAARATFAMYAHGAVFAEVRVDPDLGQIQVSRLVGAFAAGRIVNPKLARSQLVGGMVWGLSLALHEHAIRDKRSARVINADLADYRIPVNADLPSAEALLVEEHDPHVNALGVKGLGELGITGTAGAIANAVWHATGVRVRQFPVRIEDLLR